jgi:hypothetical protein
MGVYLVKQRRNAAIAYLVEAENEQDAMEKLADYSNMPGITPKKLSCSDELTNQIDSLKESEDNIDDVLL